MAGELQWVTTLKMVLPWPTNPELTQITLFRPIPDVTAQDISASSYAYEALQTDRRSFTSIRSRQYQRKTEPLSITMTLARSPIHTQDAKCMEEQHQIMKSASKARESKSSELATWFDTVELAALFRLWCFQWWLGGKWTSETWNAELINKTNPFSEKTWIGMSVGEYKLTSSE